MRLKLQITGLVQGVGFRPFVFRVASELGLKGYVLNDSSGVTIDAEGQREKLDEFLVRIERDRPAISRIFSLQHRFLEKKGFDNFDIRESEGEIKRETFILPDVAVCEECLEELTDSGDRRFLYPFINCTNCGPRFTIIEDMPYDRKNTSMKDFRMCDDCEGEYGRPADRRFHAQPDACEKCGPRLSLYDREGGLLSDSNEALEKAIALINEGHILAVKGIGGYHLMCDAENEETVALLRRRKDREEKPLAVMFPDLNRIRENTDLNGLEERAIKSIERPIVIVNKKDRTVLADSVSPGNKTVGVFLPYTPLHYLILNKLKGPVVATSANVTDDPIVKDEKEAFSRLSGIADYMLSHNREIVRRCDDSVVRIISGRQVPVRRSRGFSPLPVTLPFRLNKKVLALGPHMNNTIALGIDNRVYLSQHIGDLDTRRSAEFYRETIDDFLKLFGINPEVVVSDMHPGYYSTKFGEEFYKDRLVKVQHHHAHIISSMAENEMPENSEVIGLAFDGTGYGTDHTIWGGEVMIASYRKFERVCNLHPFKLPGGEQAVKEPCRTAFSLLYETIGDRVMDTDLSPFSGEERSFFLNMIKKEIHSPVATSMGRLFDGVASIIGLEQKVSYHGQAAVSLEQLALTSEDRASYPFNIEGGIIDQRPMIEMIINDLRSGFSKDMIARRFHNTIVSIIIEAAEMINKETGLLHVVLSGGVFQNSIISAMAFEMLGERGFIPLVHQLVPPNDGGISLGQVAYVQ